MTRQGKEPAHFEHCHLAIHSFTPCQTIQRCHFFAQRNSVRRLNRSIQENKSGMKTDDQIWAGKCFHPSTHHGGESEMEVKNWKNLNPKMVFDQNIFFKIHKFLVISHIDETSWSVHWPQGVYMRLITTNWWLFNLDFGCKTPLGSWFFEFFDSKKMPSLWAFYWCWKKFHPTFWSVWTHWTVYETYYIYNIPSIEFH